MRRSSIASLNSCCTWKRSFVIIACGNDALADSIIADAQQQALTIAGEQEIVRLAQQQADDIRDRAQQYERETRYAAEDYAEQVFTHLEENLKSLTGTVTRCRQQLNEGAAQQNGQW